MSSQEEPPAESWFRLWWDGGIQRPGEPLDPGSGQAMLLGTPMQWFHALDALTSEAIQGLMLVIEHGYRPGQATVIVGFGGPWLREHGMRKGPAERAAKELTEKGYVRRENLPGHSGPIGKKMGVVPGGLLQDIPDAPGTPASLRSGRAQEAARQRWARGEGEGGHGALAGAGAAAVGGLVAAPGEPGGSSSSRNPGTGERETGEAVDNPSSRTPGTRGPDSPDRYCGPSSQDPGTRDPGTTNVQVSASSRDPGTRLSTGPTRSQKEEDRRIFFSAGDQPVPQTLLDEFLVQDALRTRLAEEWETAVAVLSQQMISVPERCQRALRFLGQDEHAHPANALAATLVELLTLTPEGGSVAPWKARLKSSGVSVHSRTARRVIAGTVAATLASLHVESLDSLGGWFGSAFKDAKTWYPTPILVESLLAFNGLLNGEEVTTVPVSGVTIVDLRKEEGVPGGGVDEEYRRRLQVAAVDTGWNTPEGLALLLANPRLAQQCLTNFEQRRAEMTARIGTEMGAEVTAEELRQEGLF